MTGQSILRTIFNAALYGMTLALVVIAVLLSAIRLYPDFNLIVQHKVEQHLHQSLNAQVDIGSLQVSRRQPFSELIAERVSITPAHPEAQAWGLDRIEIQFDLLASLFSQQLKLKRITLVGLDISLHRDQAGQIHVNHEFPLWQDKNSDNTQFSASYISVYQSKIRWSDAITGVDYQFLDVSALLAPRLLEMEVSLSARLPERLGKTINLQARINGSLAALDKAKIKFYADLQQIHIDQISQHLPPNYALQTQAIVALRAWGEYNQGQLKVIQGSLDLAHLQDRNAHVKQALCLSDQVLEALSLDYQLTAQDNQWLLLADNINARFNGQSAPAEQAHQLSLKINAQSPHTRQISFYINSLNLGALCNSMHAYMPDLVEQRLAGLRAHALLEDLVVHIEQSQDQKPSFQYAATFHDATLWHVATDRKIAGLSGRLSGGDRSGRVSLTSQQVELLLPQMYPADVLQIALTGELDWQHYGQIHSLHTERLAIENNDLALATRFTALLDKDQIYSDAQVYIERASAAELNRYLPALKQISRTKKWFADAVHEGQLVSSNILLRGLLSEFPFHKRSGVILADVLLRDAVIEYKRDWPAFSDVQATISLNKDRVVVLPTQGIMYDSQLTRARLEIPSFLKAVLEAEGELKGGGQNLIHFLADAGLVARQNSVADQLSLEGDTKLQLSFTKSLSQKVALPFRVSGMLNFIGNTLHIHAANMAMQDLRGTLAFDQDGAYGEYLSASLYGHKLALSAKALGAGASELYFNGKFDVDAYISSQLPQFKPFIQGQTPIQGTLYLPSMFKQNNPEKLTLSVLSQLQGIQSNLPYPLHKSASESLATALLFDQKQASMRWQFADQASLLFTMDQQQPFTLRLIELGQPTDTAYALNQGLNIVGQIDRLPIESWVQTYQQYTAELTRRGINNTAAELPRVDLHIQALDWSPWPAQDMSLQAAMEDDNYVLAISSSLATGRVLWPQLANAPIVFDMQEFRVHHNEEKSEQVLDPNILPAFVFKAKRFHLKDKLIRAVDVTAETIHDGLFFSDVNFALVDLRAHGQGSWRQTDKDNIWSEFSFDMTTSDLADALESLNFQAGLRNGNGSIKTQLSWPDAPHKVNLGNMTGRTSLDIRAGSITEVEPGAGRLLALFNLSALTRRLSLDFKDVTTKGFAFNTISGDLDLQSGGEMKMEQVIIDSSAAVIEFTGTTNIVARTYAQNIFVTPSVTESLPAAGAIVGGPIGAAAGFVVDKVAKVVGLDKALKYQYSMTGTWEQPEIVKIKKVSDESSEENTLNQ